MRGKFIVFEGGDGSGKSTQSFFLKDYLERQGYVVTTTREPGGTPTGEEIREILLRSNQEEMSLIAQQLLFWAARALNVVNVIKPHVEEGRIVLCDRFDASTYAYQMLDGIEGHELRNAFWKIRSLVIEDLFPQYIFLDGDPEILLGRIGESSNRESNHFDEKHLKFHQGVRRRYRHFFNSIKPLVVVSAEGSKEATQEAVTEAVQKLLD